jgi:hypothetical protein
VRGKLNIPEPHYEVYRGAAAGIQLAEYPVQIHHIIQVMFAVTTPLIIEHKFYFSRGVFREGVVKNEDTGARACFASQAVHPYKNISVMFTTPF